MSQDASTAWRVHFNKGIAQFKQGKCAEALVAFSKAIKLSEDPVYSVYDSRASVFMRLDRPKDALGDSKKVIDLVPSKWQGYARAAQAFLALEKYASAVKMVDMALERLGEVSSPERRRHLEGIRSQALDGAHHTLLASTNHFAKLPVEIVGMIFDCAALSLPHATPVRLSHVCQHWRTVALAQRALWCTLVLSNAKSAPSKIRTWNERSGRRIFSLRIGQDVAIREFTFHTPSPTLLALRDTDLRHVRSLSWTGCAIDIFHAALASVGQEGLLRTVQEFDHENYYEHLSLSEKFPSKGELDPQPTKVGGGDEITGRATIRLQTLRLRGIQFDWERMAFYCRKLVSVTLEDSPCGSAADPIRFLLQVNPFIETLVMGCRAGLRRLDTSISPDDIASSLTLAHLRHLELDGVPCARQLTNGLRLPLLEVLRLHRLVHASNVLTSLVEGIDAEQLALRELTITCMSVVPSILMRTLLRSPALTKLCLNKMDISINDVAESLSQTPTSLSERHFSTDLNSASFPDLSIICPSLTHVDFSHCEGLGTGPIVRMVSKKRALALPTTTAEGTENTPPDTSTLAYPVQSIHTLILDGCPRIEAESLPWLRSNVSIFSCQYMTKKQATRKR
ncbi:hypothetical protein FA95DRAFT_1682082 [Auriscalpium vulgare]|uniref:Uncharacterized protein n=1 Tax=Auriscalpium vulgare TaxID=40419 RepID=A0ACB8RG39_9AGAM|nr:hypothetical protein FA95DRAFT_1682082 [Auriscalpium vulgare]